MKTRIIALLLLGTAGALNAASIELYAQGFATTIAPVLTGTSTGAVATPNPSLLHPNALSVIKKIYIPEIVDQIVLATMLVTDRRPAGSLPITSIVAEGITIGLGTGYVPPTAMSTVGFPSLINSPSRDTASTSSTTLRNTANTVSTSRVASNTQNTSSSRTTTLWSSSTTSSHYSSTSSVQSVAVYSPTMATVSQVSSTTSTTSTTAPAPTGYYISQTFIDTILRYHNNYRALHAAPPVTWDPIKALYAQRYANECVLQHSNGPYGENLAVGGFSNPAYYVYLW